MKLYEAKDLIKDVFEHAFDKDRFTRLVKNLLKDIEEKTFTYQGNIIPNAFENYIRKMERIGKFEDEEGNSIDILVVELLREHSIEYARSAQRNFVRWYLSGSRGGQMKDAALAAFHSEKSSDWRFSLIKMQYSLETKKDEFTPAKRFSFLVGEKGKSHTAQRQLVKLLKSDDIPLLSDLEEAFNIESVTNEFFEKYKALVFNLEESLDHILVNDPAVQKEFETKKINALEFSKKLMGQIVFLYFLQRKGWLGVQKRQEFGEGDRNFLRNLYNQKSPKENFFNDYLEHLFYDALNNNKRSTDFYPRFNCKIPFLNGGLFDPIGFYDWENTTINLLDDIFTNDIKTKEGDTGTGILDIFDLYNFTVNEAEPLEKEVAVDPEMLGKVFERMLDVKERKSKGAFYTPREIVHYMSQESLIHYLDTALNVFHASSMRTNDGSNKSALRKQDIEDKRLALKQDACDILDTIMYFDPNAPIDKKQRNLPHWQQKGTAYFVTFRLYDSIPKEAADKIKKEREQWFRENNISDSSEVHRLNKEKRIDYYKLFSKRYDELLDNGYGSCVLAQPKCFKIVEDALKYFEGSRYELDEFAIQPNHVHCIVIPKGDWSLSQITHSWKSYTANEINKVLGGEGTLWMAESFDHIIRSAAQFEKIREYIVDQASSLRVDRKQRDGDESESHRQNACDTVPKEDIEFLIKQGEHFLENEEQVLQQGEETKTYKHKIPESIRRHARLIDEKLRDIRVCDPAVGSGAFPVGVMTEIVKARQILTPFVTQSSRLSKEQGGAHASGLNNSLDIGLEARSTYAFKSHCIHHNLYGVDIDASAVEICKLRLWLSLVVDEQRIDVIEPLPNLDYKIVRGNSLINMPDDVMRDQQLEKEIERLMEKYYAETDKQAKRALKDEIDGKIKQLLKSAEQFTNYPIDFDFKLFFHEVFKEKGGFDVVIGNPPYVDSEEMVKRMANFRKSLTTIYTVTKGNWDLYIPFFEKGYNKLNQGGILTYITPNKWLAIGYGKDLRSFLKESLFKIGNCNSIKVFEAGNSPFISFITNENKYKNFKIDIFSENYIVNRQIDTSNSILMNENWGLLLGNNIGIITRMLSSKFNLSDIIDTENPFTTGEAYELLDIFEESSNVDTNNFYKFVNTGTIDKYLPLWGKKNTTYLKNYFKYPIINKKEFSKYFPKRYNQVDQPKIIIKGIRYFDSFLDEDGNYIAGKSTIILIKPKAPYTFKSILGLLNSKLVFFYIKEAFGALGIDGGINFSKNMVSGIPVVPFVDHIEILDKIVNYIIKLKSKSNKVILSFFEQLIDGMVFELYFEDDVKKAGRDILKYLTNLTPITDNMSDEQKMRVITQTFNELYDKNHPVRQNLAGMDEIEEIRIIKSLS